MVDQLAATKGATMDQSMELTMVEKKVDMKVVESVEKMVVLRDALKVGMLAVVKVEMWE